MSIRSERLQTDTALFQEIVDLATRLVDARYGALGVLNERGTAFTRFITAGIDEQTRAAFGPVPPDRGLLAATILDPRPLRMKDAALDPRAADFPHHHLPVRSFLAIPLLSGRKILGSLYLAEKKKTPEFWPADQRLMQNFARLAVEVLEDAKGPAEARRCLSIFGYALDEREAVLITDPAREIILWNRGAQALFGHDECEVLGQRFEKVLVPPEEMAEWKGSFIPRALRDLQYGKPVRYEALRLHKDGRRLHIQAVLFPIANISAGITSITTIGRYRRI